LEKPEEVEFDGLNLLPILSGQGEDWPERNLFFQWHRGDEPQAYRGFTARGPRFKLVGFDQRPLTNRELVLELFDLRADPFELHDIAEANPEVVEQMRREYEKWFEDVSGTRGFEPSRIVLGTPHENPSELSRQDWRGPKAGWGTDSLGYWEVEIAEAGKFDIHLIFQAPKEAGQVTLRIAGIEENAELDAKATEHTFEGVELPEGPARLEAEIRGGEEEGAGEPYGVRFVKVRRLEN
jgi:hypothetical protein